MPSKGSIRSATKNSDRNIVLNADLILASQRFFAKLPEEHRQLRSEWHTWSGKAGDLFAEWSIQNDMLTVISLFLFIENAER